MNTTRKTGGKPRGQPTAEELAMTKVIEAVAKLHLGVATLTARKSDRLDFHEVNVESLRAALEAAFHAGVTSGSAQLQAAVGQAPA